MFKVIAINEVDRLEIFVCTGAYVDPENPCCIIITTYRGDVRIRLVFPSLEETDSFMNLLFECDKINLYEIANDNPDMVVEVELLDESEMADEVASAMADVLGNYLAESADYWDEAPYCYDEEDSDE